MPRPTLQRVDTNGGGNYRHPEGGFVLTITGAKEDDKQTYMEIEYEIAEGEHKGRYEYANNFRRYYESSFGGATPFDKFMSAVEESNPGFDMMEWQHTWNMQALVGKTVGAVFKKRLYTAENGNDYESPRLHYCCSADTIRAGKFKVPDPVDERVNLGTKPATKTVVYTDGSYTDDVPF